MSVLSEQHISTSSLWHFVNAVRWALGAHCACTMWLHRPLSLSVTVTPWWPTQYD